MTAQPGRFIWYELITDDVPAAAAFYGAVTGWTVQDSMQPGMDYRMWSTGSAMVGGLMAIPAEAAANGMRPGWFAYVSVPDVDAAVASITAAGGTLCMPAMDIPNIGRMAMVLDPQGAAIYVMTPIGSAPSPAYAPGVTGHGGWHELHTTDAAAAAGFYAAQFGWTAAGTMDMGPMGTYHLFNSAEQLTGGMMNSPALGRPAWLYYFVVDDILAAQARLTAAGGKVLHGPTEVPGGGWVIQAMDPSGVAFAIVGPKLP